MATNEEMIKMLNAIEDKDKRRIAGAVWGNPGRFPESIVKEAVWCALREAETRGRCYNGGYRAGYESCTYWKIGDYKVTYFTDDPLFISTKLTEEMMDDLIIEEA